MHPFWPLPGLHLHPSPDLSLSTPKLLEAHNISNHFTLELSKPESRDFSPAKRVPPKTPVEMAAPAPTDGTVIKSTNSEATSDDDTVPFPLTAQEQLKSQALRREAAVGFKLQISQCRLALRYSVIGWTGTLDQVSIGGPSASLPSSTHVTAKPTDNSPRARPPGKDPRGPRKRPVHQDPRHQDGRARARPDALPPL